MDNSLLLLVDITSYDGTITNVIIHKTRAVEAQGMC